MPEPRTQLTDLVARRKAELGLSLRRLEAVCVDPESGAQAKYSWLHRLTKGMPTEAPTEGVLIALSIGIQVPLQVVKDAAGEQYMGIAPRAAEDAIWSSDLSTRITVARMGELSESERAELAQVVELWTRGKLPPGPGRED